MFLVVRVRSLECSLLWGYVDWKDDTRWAVVDDRYARSRHVSLLNDDPSPHWDNGRNSISHDVTANNDWCETGLEMAAEGPLLFDFYYRFKTHSLGDETAASVTPHTLKLRLMFLPSMFKTLARPSGRHHATFSAFSARKIESRRVVLEFYPSRTLAAPLQENSSI